MCIISIVFQKKYLLTLDVAILVLAARSAIAEADTHAMAVATARPVSADLHLSTYTLINFLRDRAAVQYAYSPRHFWNIYGPDLRNDRPFLACWITYVG